MYDVLVVGGGPAGSRVAARLAQSGLKTAVLEKRRQAGGKTCTGLISADCMRMFDIEEDVVLRRVNSGALFSPSGKKLRLHREKTQAVVVDRAALEQSFIHRAQQSGVEFHFGTTVNDVNVNTDALDIEATCAGQPVNFSAKMAVLAGGFDVKLAEKVGLSGPRDYTIGAQAEVTTGVDEIEVYFGKNVAPGFFGWLVPTANGSGLAGVMTRDHAVPHLHQLLENLAKHGKIASADVPVSSAGIPIKPPRRTYGNRVIAVGDAAGQVKPTTCGGICYGLIGADIAAETIRESASLNDFSARALSSYERRWRGRLQHELEVGYFARKFFERLSDRRIDRLFDIVIKNGVVDSLLGSEELSFDWHSAAILKLTGHHVVSRALELMHMPFRLRNAETLDKID